MDNSKTRKVLTRHLGAVEKISREFKAFISRGNVVDLAVGVIIGGAFGKIVSSLVNDIVMPLIGVLLGGLDLTALTINIGAARITYGVFIQNILNFLIIAASIFLFIKIINRLAPQPADKTTVKKDAEQIALLTEIRDELKKTDK